MARNKVRQPTSPQGEEWKILVKDLKLDDGQRRALRTCLDHAFADLESFSTRRRSRDERKTQISRLKSFHTALQALVDELEQDPERLAQALPFDAQDAIGLWLADQAVRVESGEAGLEGQPDHVRRSLGLKQPTELLTAALTDIKEPIDRWLAKYKPDRGGLEPDVARDFLIISLANDAEAIIGEPATSAAKSSFSNLCTFVLDACKVNTEGLEAAIGRAMQKRAANPQLGRTVRSQ